MDLDIKGLRVLVTAGANGIGLAIARAFACEGAKVHTCDVDATALAALAASDPAITQTKCDVSDRHAVKKLFEDATARLGGRPLAALRKRGSLSWQRETRLPPGC